MRKFAESDWQQMRRIKDRALARYCTDVLVQLRDIIDPDRPVSAHEAYLEVFDHIKERDEMLSVLFDDWRHSNATIMLMGWATHGLMTEVEFEGFSEETQAWLVHFGQLIFYKGSEAGDE